MEYIGTCSLEEPWDEMLCYFEEKKLAHKLEKARNMVVLTRGDLLEWCPQQMGHKYVIVDNPRAEFCRLHNKWHENFHAFSKDTHRTYPNVTIHPGAIIGDHVRIGGGTVIMPNVTIYNSVLIGENTVINSGSVIGAEGFSSLVDEDGIAHLIRNVGTVLIGNNVTIGANNCIDRATFRYTRVMDYVKTDNFVHIAHNCTIGKSTRIAPMTCLAGSCTVGERVWISVGASIREHTVIGDDCFVNMGSVVIDDIPQYGKVAGNYAMDSRRWMHHYADLKSGYSYGGL